MRAAGCKVHGMQESQMVAASALTTLMQRKLGAKPVILP